MRTRPHPVLPDKSMDMAQSVFESEWTCAQSWCPENIVQQHQFGRSPPSMGVTATHPNIAGATSSLTPPTLVALRSSHIKSHGWPCQPRPTFCKGPASTSLRLDTSFKTSSKRLTVLGELRPITILVRRPHTAVHPPLPQGRFVIVSRLHSDEAYFWNALSMPGSMSGPNARLTNDVRTQTLKASYKSKVGLRSNAKLLKTGSFGASTVCIYDIDVHHVHPFRPTWRRLKMPSRPPLNIVGDTPLMWISSASRSILN